jgi:hypothetical protein
MIAPQRVFFIKLFFVQYRGIDVSIFRIFSTNHPKINAFFGNLSEPALDSHRYTVFPSHFLSSPQENSLVGNQREVMGIFRIATLRSTSSVGQCKWVP